MASRNQLTPILRTLARSSTRLGRNARSQPSLTVRYLSTSQPRPFQRSLDRQGKFTSETYPDLKRDERFSQLTPEHVNYFRELLGKESAVIDGVSSDSAADDLEPFNSDWMRKYRGHCKLALRPGSTEEVSKILKYCNDKKLAVVPQGGNTGLVGGSVPVFDEIVISMGRMNQIHEFDEVSGTLVVDAGVILETADHFLAEKGYIFPLDLGAKGSCQIGGNLSTNAGGLRLLRYGSLHGTVLGIEAVLPDGTIIDDLCKLRKNNTGYDIKQLFIGSEGTIGIITKATIQCPQRSKAQNVAYFGLESFEKVQQAFREAKGQLSEILSAFELMDEGSQTLVTDVTKNRRPLDDKYPFYCLIETSGSNSDHDSEKLQAFLEDVMEKGIVLDGTLAQDETQIKALWGWREGITEALSHLGSAYKYDVSIPLKQMYQLVEDTRARVDEAGLLGDTDEHPVRAVIGYGHMGDSNLHLNVSTRRYDERVEKVLEPFIYEWIAERQGSISAEHGLGIAKKKYIGYSRSATMIGLMKQIKGLYDPVSLSLVVAWAPLLKHTKVHNIWGRRRHVPALAHDPSRTLHDDKRSIFPSPHNDEMVGVPGKYKGCNTCRLRRVKCDNERPFCKKCIDSGRDCAGYERETVFIIGTIEDQGRCSSHPPRVVKSSSSSSSSSKRAGRSTPSARSSPGSKSEEKEGASSNRPQLPLPPPPPPPLPPRLSLELVPDQPLQPAWDDLISLSNSASGKRYLVQIAAVHTNLQDVARGPGNGGTGDDDADNDDDGRSSGGNSSSSSNKFTFLSFPPYEPPDPQPLLNEDDFRLRSQCMVHLSSPLEDNRSETTTTTDSICLFLYEHNNSVIFSNQPPWKDQTIQNNTVRRLGPEAFRSFPNHHFFVRVYRHNAISAALLNRKPTFLSSPEWLTSPFEHHPKSVFDRLFDIAVLLPSIFARADHILPQEQTLARRLMAQDLLTNCLNVERQFEQWYSSVLSSSQQNPGQPGSSELEEVFWIEDSESGSGFMTFADTFAFRDGVTATMFIYYWTFLVTFYPVMERLYWTIFEPVVDGAIPQTMPVLPSHLQQINPLKYSCGKTVREFAANICRSLDFALNSTVQPDMLVVPLFVVRQFYTRVPGMFPGITDDGRLELMWCEAFRQRLLTKGQDILDVVQSKKWVDLAGY
ncbi:hypothetical protein QBC46DRAFT_309455 [Diplogelasinospora grovesii]|uniref:D-lactate dehydrogenase (cytochrome) n=1 Tax=Diplogelasinospora grovesii TaxID=303347 RepID=A0AAN6NAZ6_9PEZI|nr:hypothetical protein QBC46DRAFT_309455 [Diplogelasinospora grovesii]